MHLSTETDDRKTLLALHGVTYSYAAGRTAVNNISMNLGCGVVGLLGPNGAGKSSLMSILATLRKPSSGTVLWCGEDVSRHPNALRGTLGYLPQSFGVYPMLTAGEFLLYLAAVKGLNSSLAKQRVAYALECVGLSDFFNQRLGTFSGGMKQRIGIAQTLLNDPKLLILDEPTVGLDPEERLRFRLLLSELAQKRLIILSTHIVSDIESSAFCIAVINKGELRYQGDLKDLLTRSNGRVWEGVIPVDSLSSVRARFSMSDTVRCLDGFRVRVISNVCPFPDAVNVSPSLEDAYLCELAPQVGG